MKGAERYTPKQEPRHQLQAAKLSFDRWLVLANFSGSLSNRTLSCWLVGQGRHGQAG